MSDSDDDRTDSRTESKSPWRPGVSWLVALVAVVLLLALIGWGALGTSNDDAAVSSSSADPSTTLTAAPAPTTPPVGTPHAGVKYGAMSIVRSANGFTLTGEVPDDSFKASLPQSLRQAMPGAAIVDELVVTPGVTAPEIAGLGGLFGVAFETPGFSAKLVGDTVTLTGNAPSADLKAAAEDSAKTAWPNIVVVNDIRVAGAGVSTATSAPRAPSPGPTPAGGCATLQADLASVLRTPITFATGGFTLAPEARRLVEQIAERVKACPNARLVVTGYTDDTGSDAINVPLSASRATSVADALVAAGVSPSAVTSSGAGSASPLAGNDTPQGRAENRRVEISVS